MIVRSGFVILALLLASLNFGCTGRVGATASVNGAPMAPSITAQPTNRSVSAGQTASFSVAATGTAPLSYQWNRNGAAISGATSSSYATPATTSSDNGALFTVVVSNTTGSVTSNAATLTVTAAPVSPSITTQPASQTVTAGQTASFSVAATGNVPLSYQWQKDGVLVSGAISSSYTTPAATSSDNGAQFTVVVSNNAGSATSNAAILTVNAAPAPGTINVLNYGATGNGSTDDTTAINTAIAALAPGDTLLFPCGNYLMTSQLSITTAGVTVDGSGCAEIHGVAAGGNIMVVGNDAFTGSYGPAIALTATANELDISFTTVSALGAGAGDYVYIRQGGKDYSTDTAPGHDTDCDVSGCRGELLKVASVSGNTVTVTSALHDTYDPFTNAAVAQKLLNPISGVTVKNITLDGSGTEDYGLQMLGVVDSTVAGVTSKNVVFTAFYGNSDFNLAWNNVTVTGAGNANGAAMSLWVQGDPAVNGASISNLNSGPGPTAFGIEISGAANGTFSNITVDASGAYGRPLKTTAARYNTFNSTTVKNGVQAYNGISLEYYSSHNSYNNCTVTNNGAGTGNGTGNAGINTFGNFNQYNSFNNCTVSGNGNVQLYISGFDALGLAQDSHNTVSGGTFTGSNSSEAVMLIEGEGTFITGATINGPGAQGIYLDTQASNACVNNITFTAGSGLGTAISANSSGDLGLGNILNLLGSNLALGVCEPPLP